MSTNQLSIRSGNGHALAFHANRRLDSAFLAASAAVERVKIRIAIDVLGVFGRSLVARYNARNIGARAIFARLRAFVTFYATIAAIGWVFFDMRLLITA